jgi:hypothetical protein
MSLAPAWVEHALMSASITRERCSRTPHWQIAMRLLLLGDYASASVITAMDSASVAIGISQLEDGNSSFPSEGEGVGTTFFSHHLGPGPRM